MTSSGWVRADHIVRGDIIRVDPNGPWVTFESWCVDSNDERRAHVSTDRYRYLTRSIARHEMVECL